MFNNLRGFLGFSKREMNGVLVCIPLILFFIFIPSLYTKVFTPDYDSRTDQATLDSLVTLIQEKSTPQSQQEVVYFVFDPNKISIDSLAYLGVQSSIAKRIDNYRIAGGIFRKKSDLNKIYGFPDSLYLMLEDYVQIKGITESSAISSGLSEGRNKSRSSSTIKKRRLTEEKVAVALIDINTADTSTLKSLYGVGSVYSRRIVKFRSSLGGFYAVNQLKDVYGLSDSLFMTFAHRLTITDSTLNKININLASFKELNRHPYISYEQTKSLFNNKSKIGKYNSPEDLYAVKDFDSAQVRRLLPYLIFR